MGSDLIQVRVPSEVKVQAEAIFSGMGMKTGEAIRVFLQQTINSGGLPFQPHLKVPNADTVQAMRESEEGRTEETSLAALRREMGLDVES